MAKRYFKFSETHRTFGRVKLKRCTKCKKWKEESEFHKDRARRDGLRLYCKDCHAAYLRERYRKEGKAVRKCLRFEERHRIVRGVKEKQCCRCQQWKYESDFSRNRRLRDGLSCRCKECDNEQARKRLEHRKKDARRNVRYEDRHRVVNGVKEKLCTKCGEWKKESEYYRQRSSRDGLSVQCKRCSYKATKKSDKSGLAVRDGGEANIGR
ncbi:MAG TPA: hypothetical protein VMX13_07500 [Sedimentisphaerales bacterium]|nr:hypothetical protein [Sedimentisphaerales bacterium]